MKKNWQHSKAIFKVNLWLIAHIFIKMGEYKWDNQFVWKINVTLAYKLAKFQTGH